MSAVMRTTAVLTIGALILVGVDREVFAQTARHSDSGDPAARVQAEFQRLSAERATLQEENRTLKEKTTKLEAELKTLQSEKHGLDARLQHTEGQLSVAERDKKNTAGSLEAQEARLKEIVTKYRELAENLRTVEAERNRLAGELKVRTQEFGTCSKDNVELADLAGEALDRYDKKGCLAVMGQREPFTQIGRARVENLREDYRQRIDALKVPPPAGEPAVRERSDAQMAPR